VHYKDVFANAMMTPQTERERDEYKKFLRSVFEKRLNFYWKTRSHVDPRFLELIATYSRVAAQQFVIDFGTGVGIVALSLSSRVGDKGLVVGIDLTPKSLKYARTWAKGSANLVFTASDVEKLPFRDKSFDAACSRFVFHHLVSPMETLHEIYRILRHGGYLLIADGAAPDEDEADNFLNTVGKTRDPSHIRYYRINEITHMILNANFSGLQIYNNPIPYPLGLREWVNSADRFKYTTLKKRFTQASDSIRRVLRIVNEGDDIFFAVPTVIIVARKEP
jgi:ubiquinone/menaquinone biosynthesis C-methylase UbiE